MKTRLVTSFGQQTWQERAERHVRPVQIRRKVLLRIVRKGGLAKENEMLTNDRAARGKAAIIQISRGRRCAAIDQRAALSRQPIAECDTSYQQLARGCRGTGEGHVTSAIPLREAARIDRVETLPFAGRVGLRELDRCLR